MKPVELTKRQRRLLARKDLAPAMHLIAQAASASRTHEQAYEWELKDENVDESIRINEYEFTLDGKRSVIL
jgi:hypothetical protein